MCLCVSGNHRLENTGGGFRVGDGRSWGMERKEDSEPLMDADSCLVTYCNRNRKRMDAQDSCEDKEPQ